VEQAARQGVQHFGVTDHLHCRLNLPGIENCRREFDALGPVNGFHFGIEVSCLREWDIQQNDARGANGSRFGVQPDGPDDSDLTVFLPDGLRERLGVEYVIGGAHWPLGAALKRDAMIRSYHRQNMFLAHHPDVDIVAHPWWWMGAWEDSDGVYRTLPWFDNFKVIPESLHREFAGAVIEHHKAVEINAEMLVAPNYPQHFPEQYLEYLALLKSCGVTFSVGSDAHTPSDMNRLSKVENYIRELGLTPEELWSVTDSIADSSDNIP